LRHPFRRAESSFSQFPHRLDDDVCFSGHLNSQRDEGTDDENADREREQNSCDGWMRAFAGQPLANGPRCNRKHTSPGKRRQEALQDPNRCQNQYRNEDEAAEEL
jgi:hypothetical protein